MRTVLFILGIEDSNRVTVRSVQPQIAYELTGSIDIFRDLRHRELRHSVLIVGGPDPVVPAIERPDIIFNCITDADRSRRALELAIGIIRQHPDVPVINRPVHVLRTRRDDVADALAGITGLQMPVTRRIVPASHHDILAALETGPVRYPAIVRSVGEHGGAGMLLLRSADDAGLLDRIACDGSPYYLIQYMDFRDDDGLFRKTRLVVAGSRVFARHQLASTDWNVHASVRDGLMLQRKDLQDAEAGFLRDFGSVHFPALAQRIETMQQRLRLDYFSIDCSLRPDGDILVFEANASGNALRQPGLAQYPYLRQPVQQLQAAVMQMLLQATAP